MKTASGNAKPAPVPAKQTYSSIPTRTLLALAWRNILYKKLRTILTVAGVVIGVGAIYFMLSFGLGLQQLITSQVIGNQSINTIDVSSTNSKLLKLSQKTFEQFRGLPHVTRAGASYSFAGGIKYQGSEVGSIVYGVDVAYQDLANLDITPGRGLATTDNRVALVSKPLLQSMGITDPKTILGKQLSIRIPLRSAGLDTEIADTFTIVGVVNGGSGSELFVLNHIFQLAGVDAYTQLKLEADRTESITTIRRQIEALGFTTASPVDTIDQINQVFKFVNLIAVGFGAIGMIVAVLGMFNTLTISLLERTKEIGLMIALGGRRKDMRKLFVFEALILSVLGALGGLLLAMGCGTLVDRVMNTFSHHRGVTDTFTIFDYRLSLALLMVILMCAIGLLVVYFPARRAEHTNPIEALRRE